MFLKSPLNKHFNEWFSTLLLVFSFHVKITLTTQVLGETTPTEKKSLEKVLGKFGNVNHC